MSAHARKHNFTIVSADELQPDCFAETGNSRTSAVVQSEICSFCFGSGMEVVLGKGARRCRCRSQESRARLLEQARIPARYENCSLANYHPASNNGTQLRAFNYAFKLMSECPAVDRGLLFMGTVGVGKTHLTTAIMRGLIEKGVNCLLYEFGALLKEIQSYYNPV